MHNTDFNNATPPSLPGNNSDPTVPVVGTSIEAEAREVPAHQDSACEPRDEGERQAAGSRRVLAEIADSHLAAAERAKRSTSDGDNAAATATQQLDESLLEHADKVTVIRPRDSWQMLDWKELYDYRDLFVYLIRREVKVRYAQSAIGLGWAILQPLCTMLILTVIFGRLARIPSDGVPYSLFCFAGLVPWLFFANGVIDGVNSLIQNSYMLSKVYFPRMLLPLSAVAARFVDFVVASGITLILMACYGFVPNTQIVALPWVLGLMLLTAGGVTLWLSTLAIQYRDVKHALTFAIQILMYSAPIVYPVSLVPERFQNWYALNPMVGVTEGLRSMLLGTNGLPWSFLLVGSLSSLLMALTGALYFNHRQRAFADVA